MKINRKAIEKRIKDEAAKVWPKTQVPTCLICKCTPNKACEMGKDYLSTCWWVVPGLCSKCQQDGKSLQDAVEAVPEAGKAAKKAAKG